MRAFTRNESPEVYALRDRLGYMAGIPLDGAHIIASELVSLQQQVLALVSETANLKNRIAALEKSTPPHLAKAERR